MTIQQKDEKKIRSNFLCASHMWDYNKLYHVNLFLMHKFVRSNDDILVKFSPIIFLNNFL